MTYHIYADVVLLNNFLMDYALLSLVHKMFKLKVRKRGLLLSGLSGSVYSLLILLFPMPVNLAAEFFLNIGMSVGMVILAYEIHTVQEFKQAAAGFYLCAFLMAGMFHLFPSEWFSGVFGYGMMVFCGLAAIRNGWRLVSANAVRNSHLYQAVLCFGETKIMLTALLDTGNHMTDPYTGAPVSIVWGKEIAEAAAGRTGPGFFYLPFRTVGCEHGVLPAIRADSMEIYGEERSWRLEHPCIAVADRPLSQNGTYQMLLHEKMLL